MTKALYDGIHGAPWFIKNAQLVCSAASFLALTGNTDDAGILAKQIEMHLHHDDQKQSIHRMGSVDRTALEATMLMCCVVNGDASQLSADRLQASVIRPEWNDASIRQILFVRGDLALARYAIMNEASAHSINPSDFNLWPFATGLQKILADREALSRMVKSKVGLKRAGASTHLMIPINSTAGKVNSRGPILPAGNSGFPR